MNSDLVDWSKAASSLLPNMAEDDGDYEFNREMFPDIPKNVEFRNFAVLRGTHEYMDTIRVDYLQISATKEACKSLGLAILAAAFHAKDVWITLSNEKTDYRFLSILGSEMTTLGLTNYRVALKEFHYSPCKRSTHPFHDDRLTKFPAFFLSCSNEETPPSEVWEARDTVEGFGQLEPSLRLAEFLLDIARSNNSENEFVLEGPAGNQGVDALSAEVRIWLPGARGYELCCP